jgi:hypothetical protein
MTAMSAERLFDLAAVPANVSGSERAREAPRPLRTSLSTVAALLEEYSPQLWGALTPAGRARFMCDLLAAREESEAGDSKAFARVWDMWYRSLRLQANPKRSQMRASAGTGEVYSPEQLRAKLGL